MSTSAPTSQASTVTTSGGLASTLSFGYLGSAQSVKPAKLYLTPNQLYYLLCRFEELGVSTGAMNVRLENLHADHTPSNYVSFLAQAQRPKGRSSDQDSIHSVSSVRSVMSSMTSMWSGFGLSTSAAKVEKRKAVELEDLRYLYSAFTKIPCFKLALDHRAPRIAGYEEFPFDTAVPVHAFKNLNALEIVDLDFRSIYGWDRLADQLRSLTLKRAGVEDLLDLLVNIVLDDADGRRRRSAKNSTSPVLAHPIPSTLQKQSDIARSSSVPDSPTIDGQRSSCDRPVSADMALSSYLNTRPTLGPRLCSKSPPRPVSSRRGSAYTPGRPGGKARQSSGSSTSSATACTPRNSSLNLLSLDRLASKWRFLRHLSLADNALMSISRHSLQPLAGTLQSLDLSSNLFSEIPESLASLVSLRALNLSNCMIESLHSLSRSPLPAINVLNLRGNRISSLVGIEKLLSLERLDLRENRLRDPTELARLTGMPDFQEVYVSRNPFVKTHSNYRITIFNLFRNSPGYIDDVVIDGQGPGYGERRQLVDRAPEVTGIPIIQAPMDEDGQLKAPDNNDVVEPMPAEMDVTTELGNNAPHEELYVRGQRRRKGPKRRIVDISQSDSMQKSTSASLGIESPSSRLANILQGVETAQSTSEDDSYLKSTVLSPIPTSPASHHYDNDGHSIVEPERPEPATFNSNQYRKRLESLKRDYGDSWLTALGDKNWEGGNGNRSPGYFPPTEKEISSPASLNPMQPKNAPVMSSNRRLG